MHYVYSYVKNNQPYYIGKGHGRRAYTQSNHSVDLPLEKDIHILNYFKDSTSALLREWELISFLQLRSEGGILDNKVKGCCPPDQTGCGWYLTEKTKQKMRKPKNYVRTAEHSEKIAQRLRGKKLTEEHKQKIGKASLGNKHNLGKDNRALEYIIVHPDGREEVVRNMRNFCEEHNLSRAMMCGVCKGKYKQHRGFTARYK